MKKKEEIIRLKDVWKIYREGEENAVYALSGINISIKKGDFVAIMGPSGSGKSTAMNLIGSLDVPTRGQIYLDKNNISHLTESDLAQIRGKKIGFIFQQFNLIPNLTAKENVMLPMIFQKVEEEDRIHVAEKLLELVDLKDRMDHTPSELSGGEQQRVAIARSLANDPDVILADEPTGNLDTKTGEKIMDFLTDLNRKGKTVIIVTHDPDLAIEHAKKIYWIKDGKVEKITKGKGNGKRKSLPKKNKQK